MTEPHDANASIGAELHDFGIVAEHGDSFEFLIDGSGRWPVAVWSPWCKPSAGHAAHELAEISGATWRKISARAVRELAAGHERQRTGRQEEPQASRPAPTVSARWSAANWPCCCGPCRKRARRTKSKPSCTAGANWRAKSAGGSTPKPLPTASKAGSGWRRALFHALSESTESRAAPPPAEKKSPKRTGSPRSSASYTPEGNAAARGSNAAANPSRPVARKKKDSGSGNDPQIDLF